MSLVDCRGNAVSTTNPALLERLELATTRLASYTGDPLGPIAEALAIDPDFAMGHAFLAGLAIAAGEAATMPILAEAVAALDRLGARANDRERAHGAAARAWLEGDVRLAVRRFGRIVVDHPRDLFALQVAHLGDFLLGDAVMLRDRPAGVVPRWSPDTPGAGHVLGMYAFGLEETGSYARAEDTGLRALALERRDPWAVHAVAHVMEMQGRLADGVSWLEGTRDRWADDCGFAFHNWWHLGLFHLDLGAADRALAIYDERVHPKASRVALELIDASAMLWRLHLRGVDAGERWAALADDWAAVGGLGFYAFNDVHELMAALGAGRSDMARAIVEAMQERVARGGTNAAMTREVGLPLARGLVAFARGDWRACADEIGSMRAISHRFGGSHAQRELVQLTLLEAAVRGGDAALATAVAAERTELEPASPFNWSQAARAAELAGDPDARARALEAAEARAKAQRHATAGR